MRKELVIGFEVKMRTVFFIFLVIASMHSYGQAATAKSDNADRSTVFTTVGGLRAANNIQGGVVYQTIENGGGRWYYDASDATSADNTGTVIVNQKKRLKRLFEGAVSPRWFGAAANGTADDAPAIQKAINFALSLPGIAQVAMYDGEYRLNSNVVISFLGQGYAGKKGLLLTGSNTKIFLSGGGLRIRADGGRQQDFKINIEGFYFHTNNVQRPDAIVAENIDFLSIKNCQFFQTGKAIDMSAAGMARVEDCKFFGCTYGVKTMHMRDTYITACHAYACDYGFYFEGTNDFNRDGNITLTNSAANVSAQSNLYLKKLYEPVLDNLSLELGVNNVTVESCQYGQFSNSFIGPVRGENSLLFFNTSLSNDYWHISNLDVNGRTRFNSVRASPISNLSIHDAPKGEFALTLYDCNDLEFSNLQISRTGSGISLRIEPNTAGTQIINSHIYNPLFIQGAPSVRYGRNMIRNSTIGGGVIVDGNTLRGDETLEYVNNYEGKAYILLSPYNRSDAKAQGATNAASEFKGQATLTGTGNKTSFTIMHNANFTPSLVQLVATNSTAAKALAAGYFITSKTATQFTVNFVAAPANGSLSFDYLIK